MRWEIRAKKSDNLIGQILLNRGIKKKDWRRFLAPNFDRDLGDPFKLAGMATAVKIILRARQEKEKIGIFADYDADGIPAAALLYKIFGTLGIQTEAYIPTRDEGYGLNKKGIDELIDKKCQILLAVDLGVTGRQEVVYAKKRGLQTIVLDHHLVQPGKLPPADALINPKQPACRSQFKDFSAAGLAFKLGQALEKKSHCVNKTHLKWLLDLAAISTIADIVPLSGENRVIAKFGLMVLSKTRNIGLRALYQAAAINPENISAYTVGFQISPRLNAAGRMFNPRDSFELLVTASPRRAALIAKRLNQINRLRQKETEKALKEALKKINQEKQFQRKIIMVSSQNFQPGIVGLVAGRIKDKFNRPAIVLRLDGESASGSARSIENFHIFEALEICRRHLTRHGGHARAAGLTLKIDRLADFYDEISRLADKKLTKKDLEAKLAIDALVDLPKVNLKTYQALRKLEPFGFGNPRPIFCSKGIGVTARRAVGKNNEHLKISFEAGKKLFSAIGFSLGGLAEKVRLGTKVDIAFAIDLNEFNGQKDLQLKLFDIKPAISNVKM